MWNYETQALVKTFDVAELPARTAKFIARKSWLVVGSDDMQLRVFNTNTQEKVKTKYIRYKRKRIELILYAMLNVCYALSYTCTLLILTLLPFTFNAFSSYLRSRNGKHILTVRIYFFHILIPDMRALAIHPTLPYILSCADDMLIKLWDWEKGFRCTMTYESHSHYVMYRDTLFTYLIHIQGASYSIQRTPILLLLLRLTRPSR